MAADTLRTEMARSQSAGTGRVTAVAKDEAHDHFKRTVVGLTGETLRGFHVPRHRFISTLSSEGVNLRVVHDIVGRQFEEQRRRFRHLDPKVVRDAVSRVFG